MKERPILFKGEMVRAILDDRKTQTRRLIKPQPIGMASFGGHFYPHERTGLPTFSDEETEFSCKYGEPGDRLWVKETWHGAKSEQRAKHPLHPMDALSYRADRDGPVKWTPSIFMPRWVSRLTLEVTGVRVERLQNISDADAKAEGVTIKGDAQLAAHIAGPPETPARMEYWDLWRSINGPESWDANPWVWVIEFRRLPNV